jgi:N-acyl homoserine lactone hydrolase
MKRVCSYLLVAFVSACAASDHPTIEAALGAPRALADLEAVIDVPGPVVVETVVSAAWEVQLAGMLNLAKAKLEDRSEPIELYVHLIKHPTEGTVWIDTGVERDARHIPHWLRPLVKGDKLVVKKAAADIEKPKAVFLTHTHLDHVMGLPDLDPTTPIYAGAGDLRLKSFQNMLMRSLYSDFLRGYGPVRELAPAPARDLYGDGTFWALAVPGHTPGSLAYVVRTPSGPVLFTGDASHTRYGWDRDIEPGTFSHDLEQSVRSLATLRGLASRHPAMKVFVGHQP